VFDFRKNIRKKILKGNMLYLQKRYRDALKYYLAARKINRGNISAVINCANANFMLNKYSKTIYYLRLLNNRFNYKNDALLAQCYFETEKYAQAAQYFETLIKNKCENPWIYNWLSQCYQKLEEYEMALDAGWKAVKFSKGKDVAHHLNFGYLLYEISLPRESERCLKYAKKWKKQHPDSQVAQYMARAIVGDKKSYENKENLSGICEIFEAFAPEFDETLADLEYKTPQIMEQILDSHKIGKTKVLDFGCGTGLCGKILKKHALLFGLYGVDISPNMLAQAKKKHLYSTLCCSDGQKYLLAHEDCFGLVCSADVLTYFADLSEIFHAVYSALKENGYFIFSVSQNTGKENFIQHKSGRFLHSENYVIDLAKKNGFNLIEKKTAVIRTENGVPVKGIIFLLSKNI